MWKLDGEVIWRGYIYPAPIGIRGVLARMGRTGSVNCLQAEPVLDLTVRQSVSRS